MNTLPPDLPHDFTDPRYLDDEFVRERMQPRGSFTRLTILLIAILFVAAYCVVIGTIDRLLELMLGGE